MAKKRKFKIISIITTFFVISTLISLKSLIVKATVADKPEFDIQFSPIQESAIVGEEMVVKGTIIPKPFEIPIPEREIVFVIDTDTNDNGIFNPLINGAKNFIQSIGSNEKFKNIKIGVIGYSTDSEIKSVNISSENKVLVDSTLYGGELKSAIGALKPGKSKTNTGEGLRKALYLLNSNKSKVDANKTIIFISDSIPTARTLYSKGSGKDGDFYTDISKENYDNATTANTSDSNKDLEYAKIIGELISNKGYNVFTIGYSMNTDSEGASALREIHASMTGNDTSNSANDEKNGIFITNDKNAVEGIFPKIEEKILQNYSLNNIDMNITFKEGFSLDISGNTVNLSNINYRLVSQSNGKVRYEADPIEFEFVIKGNTEGYQQIFDKVTINYPWKNEIEKVSIDSELFITIKSNENPNISAKLLRGDKVEVKNNEELTIEYEIKPENFTSNSLSTDSGKIDEAIIITDLSQNMKNGNRFSILQNGLTNQVINNGQLNLTKFGIIGYSDSVLVGDLNNINDPKNVAMKPVNETLNLIKPLFNINDGNSKDGFRQLFQNGYLYNSITNSNTRNIDEALKITKDIFDKFGSSNTRKAIILINSGSVTYSKEVVQEIKQKGYKIISLDLSGTTNTNLKNLHVGLGGRISETESDSDFLVSKSDGGNFNFGDSDMTKVADRLIAGVMSGSYSSIEAKIYFDLNNNFEYVDKSNNSNISLESYDGNKLCFKIAPIDYVYSGNMIDGKYEYVASTQTISFKVKVKSNKTGILTFAENPTVLDKNNYKNYLVYNKFNGNESKSLIYTPIFILKEEVKDINHGLYNGISNGLVSIHKNNYDGNSFEIAQGSTVTFGANFTFGGSSTEFNLNVDNKFSPINPNDIKIYKVSKDSLGYGTLKELDATNKSIVASGDNKFKISINNMTDISSEILVVYQGKIKDETASGQTLTNDILFGSKSTPVTIVTPNKLDNSPILPDLF